MNQPDKIIELSDGTFMGLTNEEFANAEEKIGEFLRCCAADPELVIKHKPLIVEIVSTFPVNRLYWWDKLGLYGYCEEDRNVPEHVRPIKTKIYTHRLNA